MDTKERVHHLVDRLSEEDLRVAERVLRGLSAVDEAQPVVEPMSPEERRARVNAARGSMKGLLSSSDETATRKQEEIALEAEKWTRMHAPQPTS